MQVYRITLEKWAKKLYPSGYPGRWNSKGQFVIYTSSSRALASLENIVHRSGEGLNHLFKVMVINIPTKAKIEEVKISQLPKNWHSFESYNKCQEIGDDWLVKNKSLILSVPSAIIKSERNFLINPNHKSFSKITISKIEPFEFDPRLKG